MKTYIEDQDGVGLNTQFSILLNMQAQKNKAYLSDNLFFNYDYEEKTFYNVKKRQYRTLSTAAVEDDVLSIVVSLDKESEEYERVVYTFLDMFGFLGGLFDFMFFSGFILIQFFIENSFLNSAFSKLYQVQADDCEPIQFLKCSRLNQSNINEDFKHNIQSDMSNEEIHSNIHYKPNTNSSNSFHITHSSTYIQNLK